MFTEDKITEIYCIADDFCKEFTLQHKKYMIENKKQKHRDKPNRMSDAEIMVHSYPVPFPVASAALSITTGGTCTST